MRPEYRYRSLIFLIESTFWDTIYVYLRRIEAFRNSGIEGLKHKFNKLKKIEFIQFLKPNRINRKDWPQRH
ncbi:hypothetical protein D1AOALGA4SA_11882 [Olavius algarvensis Delta 1 endosymbiont]|nr:hypothetical protein D1AOALGA4SA_11882 [Olavius algarvensis Delta 1 endosymbiont]